MPGIDPHQLNLFVSPVTDIYVMLENEIFSMIAQRLKTNKDFDKDYVLKWQVEKMQELKTLNAATIKLLSEATGLSEEAIINAINLVGIGTIESVDEELKPVFEKLKMPSQIDAILQAFIDQTLLEIDNFVNQTLITTNYGEGTVTHMYKKIVEETTAKVLAGTTTINKAVTETIIKWSDKGINTAFVDRGGNVWSLERYTDTVIRSTVNNTYNQLRTSRMADYGVDLVLVNSYADAREACSKIQGKVASMSNPSSNPKYPSVYEFGYGTPGGLRGINCRHILYPFVEGLNTNNQRQYDAEEAYERGKVVQKQRQLEREVRKAKRSLKLAQEIGDEEWVQRYSKLLRNRQANVREFVAENDLARRYDKEKIINIPKPSINVNIDDSIKKKYNNRSEESLLYGYEKAVDKGDIHAFVNFETYKAVANEVHSKMVGQNTSDGITITGYKTHYIDRIIGEIEAGTSYQGKRSGVHVEDTLQALQNPVEIKANTNSRQYINEKVVVTINHLTGNLIQTNPKKKGGWK